MLTDIAKYIETDFNPRTPYGMRLPIGKPFILYLQFQSTHPLRDATQIELNNQFHKGYFNPRTPYGMRRWGVFVTAYARRISIHAPLTGCDYGTDCI